MKTVTYDVKFVEKASRLELIIRFLWSIPTYIVAMIFAVVAMILMALQWIHILILGKRQKTMHEWIVKFVKYVYQWYSYLYLLTDERNPIIPEDL